MMRENPPFPASQPNYMLGTDQVLNQGRYRIIGSSGSGAVYEAYDTVSETKVFLHESVARVGRVASTSQIEAMNAAFAREAQDLAAIRHESIVNIQDYFSEIDRQYLVVESITGQSLSQYLDRATTKPALAKLVAWMEQLLAGLDHLHRLSPPIIHGDIRPEIFKLTSDESVRLLVTRVSRTPETRANADDATSARNYKPLEQLWPEVDPETQKAILAVYDEKAAGVLLRPLDPRSDIYSIAASFYHILTSTSPIDAIARSTAILSGDPDPLQRPTDIDPTIPPEISDTLMRAMSIRRENRFDLPVIMSQVLRTAVIRAKERESRLLEIPTDTTQKEIPKFPMNELENDFDPTSPEAKLELRRQLVEDRQRELEAEQAKLEEERHKIEQRRLELEAEKERHAAERERLRQEAAEAQLRAEQERKRLEKERLEQEVEQERQKIAHKLAALEAEAERERAEQERVEKEAEAERRRAEKRLQELKAEQELRRAEQERVTFQAKRELEQAEQRLLELSGSDLDVREPKRGQGKSESSADVETVFAPPLGLSDEITVPDFSGGTARPARSWRVPVVCAAALFVVGGAVAWLAIPTANDIPSAAAVAQGTITVPEARPALTEPSPVPEESSSVPQEEELTVTETGLTSSGQKHPAASAMQDKQKRPTAVKPPTKKKVTVDDLINDN